MSDIHLGVSNIRSNLEPHLLQLALTSTQALLGSLFMLPTTNTPEAGPVAKLPEPVFQLPREKPLPKPKPLTKWERFANAKGISHSKKDKKVWDDERQEWVARWGRDGKNKDSEDQWLHEYKAGDGGSNGLSTLILDVTADPRHAARAERKARVAKNERQHAKNVADASNSKANPLSSLGRETGVNPSSSQGEKAKARTQRKAELERSMLVSKTSTASLGRFDNKIEGEPRARGLKRKFDSNVGDHSTEKEQAMTMLHKLGTADRKKAPKKGGEGVDGGLNARKAIRHEERKAQKDNRRSKGKK